MRKKMFKNIEWGIVICTVILLAIGLTALLSATQNSDYEEFKKQIRPILDQVYVHAEHIIGIENVETMLSELKAVHNVLENI